MDEACGDGWVVVQPAKSASTAATKSSSPHSLRPLLGQRTSSVEGHRGSYGRAFGQMAPPCCDIRPSRRVGFRPVKISVPAHARTRDRYIYKILGATTVGDLLGAGDLDDDGQKNCVRNREPSSKRRRLLQKPRKCYRFYRSEGSSGGCQFRTTRGGQNVRNIRFCSSRRRLCRGCDRFAPLRRSLLPGGPDRGRRTAARSIVHAHGVRGDATQSGNRLDVYRRSRQGWSRT